MALSRDNYRELEDIVGPEHLTEDLATLEAYAFSGFGGGVGGWTPESRFVCRADAVVMPGSTEDVQAIIKMCNRRGIVTKAFSTGYGANGAVGKDGGLLLDLKRMNRILEIDEKNMYIVVEPYVTFAQVQGEVQKLGLNCHVIGAGSNCSYLASHTSMHGTNTQAISHGWSGRNLLAVEWVLPSGELLKLGALGSGAGWFSGDGPGPSLRGIVRGAAGARGGLGVFTKCAGHLHPWPGPGEMELTGISPYYETEVPSLFEYYVIEWPTWEQCADAQYRIGEAGIAYAFHKTGGPGSHGAVVTGSNNDYYEHWEEFKGLPWVSYAIVMAASSPQENEYQNKALEKIMEDTGGQFLPVGKNPVFKNRDYINMIKGCFIPRLAFRPTGAFTCVLNASDSVYHCAMGLKMDADFDRYRENGTIMFDGTNNMWGVAFEGGRWALCECGHLYDPTDEESSRLTVQMVQEGDELKLKTPLATNWMIMSDESVREFGPMVGNLQNWQRKVKKAFDPNTVSETTNYISPEED